MSRYPSPEHARGSAGKLPPWTWGRGGFDLTGAKSYGRARTFLFKIGDAQLDSILDGLFSPSR